MNVVAGFSVFQAMAGAALILGAILLSLQIKKDVPDDLGTEWRKASFLIFFFFACYVFFVLILFGNLQYPLEPVTASLFLGSACCIYFMIALVRTFVGKIREKDRDIEEKNMNLEREIEEHRRTEERLRSFEKAVETMQLGVTFTGTDGIIFYANPADAEMHGHERSGLVGSDVRIYAPDGLRSPMSLEAISVMKSYRRESLNVRKDGSRFHVQLMSDVVMNSEGEPISVVTTCEDITERKLMEEGLRAARDELERRVLERTAELSDAVKLLEEQMEERKKAEDERDRLRSIAEAVNTMNNIGYVFSGIRHEIGNPVNSLKMTLSVLSRKLDDCPKETIAEYVSRCMTSIARMEYLLKCLKSFNLYERPECQNVNVPQFFEKLLPLVESDFTRNGIKINVEMAPEPVCGYFDPRALQQVMLNVLTNAMDALEGREAPCVSINVSGGAGGTVNVRVADNGKGMTGEHQSQLFKPFYTTKQSGTGLGLVIAKKLLSQMNGAIGIASVPDGGTVVEITVPGGVE